ncbi:NOP5/NOP56 family protein [Methanococcoides alaskense]|uniref:Nucleolar protein 56 n=1 Tax=Methanococcoides alaskense TaxID=325778 RepID=A0AA90Z8J6_9EURY|nr:NOP5/NOP56 family protein [Methanococcoides alaskense]MDA0524865.1 NOP5/NOP56 family protein [Methanococcoides alaskense]MDR6223009.1 nucleolar protein 56 [Methanococcoides alaskense]
MKIITWYGILTIGDDGVTECEPFNKDVDELAELLLQKDVVAYSPGSGFDIRTVAIECGFVENDEEYNSLLRDVSIRAAKLQISRTNTPDMQIIQAVEALDDIDDVVNVLSERLSEWYGLHFPELGLSSEPLVRFVSEFGSRNNVPAEHPMFEKATSSMGSELPSADEELIMGFASNACELYDSRHSIEASIVRNMEKMAPNVTLIAGSLIGARLISMTGGLARLSQLPSSTVQVMGANRALFKHLRGRATSPKHGIIFNNPLVKNSPWWQRGKIARALAAKISLAARMDVYSGELHPEIKVNLEKKVNFIKAANPKPPVKQKPAGKGYKGKNKGGER